MKTPNPANVAALRKELTAAYTELFKTDPAFAYSASKLTPAELAEKMTVATVRGSASNTGPGFRRACKALSIPHTAKAIDAFIFAPPSE